MMLGFLFQKNYVPPAKSNILEDTDAAKDDSDDDDDDRWVYDCT